MTEALTPSFKELNDRSRGILRHVVETYVESGEPVGSRTISRQAGIGLSPATIRNVMADLEDAGLLSAPHTSAGRLPTEAGLRLFVHGLLEVGRLNEEERAGIETECAAAGKSPDLVLDQAIQSLSGLAHQAGMVSVPTSEGRLKHIEFVSLAPGRALVVMVMENGLVENRVLDLPIDVPVSSLTEASNYLTARMVGRTMLEARAEILAELDAHEAQIGALTKGLVETGLADWGGDAEGSSGTLIVRGQSRLLEDVKAVDDLERVRKLFETLETKATLLKLLDIAHEAEGVQIYIGAENTLFGNTGCSMIIAPYKDTEEKIIGMIGVIGPTRMNYARIIPMVDYTAEVVGRMIG